MEISPIQETIVVSNMDKSKPSLTFLDFTPEVRITIYQLVSNGVHLSLALPVSESKSARSSKSANYSAERPAQFSTEMCSSC